MRNIQEYTLQCVLLYFFFLTFCTYGHETNRSGGILANHRNPSHKSVSQAGDLVLVGLFPVHLYNASYPGGCGPLRSHDFVQLTQAIIYAVNRINNDTELLQGISLGFEILDYCSKDVIALELSSKYLKLCTPRNKKYILGFIGPYSSGITHQVSNLLGLFKIPHISYGATSPLLSDKKRFRFFLRTVPPDNHRALFISQLFSQIKTQYVSVLYSEGDFGHESFKYFEQEAMKREICLAMSREIPLEVSTLYIDSLVRLLIEKRKARVVVLFCQKRDIRKVFDSIKRLNESAHFRWLIGGDLSETYVYLNSHKDMAKYVAIFAPRSKQDLDFKVWEEKTFSGERNPWVQELKAKVETKHRFTNSQITADTEFRTDSNVENVINAVYAFAHAIDDISKDLCRNTSDTKCCLKRFATNGEILLKAIKTASFRNPSGRIIKFDKNGDIYGDYYLFQPAQDKFGKWDFKELGKWPRRNRGNERNWHVISSLFSKTVCSKPCQVGERTVTTDRCCWECRLCEYGEITVNQTTECKKCPLGHKANANRTDCHRMRIIYGDVNPVYLIISSILATAGLVCAVGILLVFILYKDHYVIKASSRGLSCVLLTGLIVSYLATYLNFLDAKPSWCTLRRYGILGYLASYAAMFSRVLRADLLFNASLRSSMHPTWISTRSQLVIIALVFGISALFFVVWNFFRYPYSVQTSYTPDAVIIQCTIETLDYVVATAYLMVILTLCAVYVFRTRKLPKQFRETKGLSTSIYLTATLQLVGLAAICSLDPERDINIRQRMIVLGQPILISTVLVPIFFSKMYLVFFFKRKNRRAKMSFYKVHTIRKLLHNSENSLRHRSEQTVSGLIRQGPQAIDSLSRCPETVYDPQIMQLEFSEDSRSRAMSTETFTSRDSCEQMRDHFNLGFIENEDKISYTVNSTWL